MCYLALTTVVLVLGRANVYAGGLVTHLAVLVAIAAATWHPRVPSWLRAWTPLIALLFLYTELPMLIRAVGHGQFYDSTVISWESALFGGQPAMQWSRRAPSLVLSELLHLAYLSYYLIIFSVPALLFIRRRTRDFGDAVFVLMLTFVACFVCYIAFPVEGPRYLWPGPDAATSGPVRAITVWLLEARSSQGTAFPSSHVAVATTQSILALRYFGARGGVLAIATTGLALGAIYGGFHYAIDVAVGACFGALIAALGIVITRILGRGPPVHANATAPT